MQKKINASLVIVGFHSNGVKTALAAALQHIISVLI
jgi:hypothetical protein